MSVPPQGELLGSFADAALALNTYEQALAFFDVQSTVADEFIPTLYTTKVSALLARSIDCAKSFMQGSS
jgi:uncharacterized protein YerC